MVHISQVLATMAYESLIMMATTIAAPIMFPRFFWKSERKPRIKTLCFDVVRDSDNPYIDEATSITLYDPDTRQQYFAKNIYDDACYEDICAVFEDIGQNYDEIYLITNDEKHAAHCFKVIMAYFIENHGLNIKFIDLKRLFYCLHPQVPNITYADMIEYYRVHELDSPTLNYCQLFEHLLEDYDMDIRDDMGKLTLLYNDMNPILA